MDFPGIARPENIVNYSVKINFIIFKVSFIFMTFFCKNYGCCDLSKRFKFFGSRKVRSMTIRMGFFPDQSRTLSIGLSRSAVFVPTSIACSSDLHLCTNGRASSPAIQAGLLNPGFRSSSIKPSLVSAHFKIT